MMVMTKSKMANRYSPEVRARAVWSCPVLVPVSFEQCLL
jgi:hypothetical protein